MRRLGSIPCQVTAHAPFPEFPISAPAPLLPLQAAQPPPNPGIQCFENRAYCAKAKVVAPSPQIQSRFPDHPCQSDPPGTVGHLANPRLKPLERLRRNPPLRLTPGGKRESQKLPLPGPGHGALCPIDLELELTGEKPAPTLHPPFPRPLTLDVEVRVIRVAHEAMPTFLYLSVKLIEEQIGQQRGERAALRRPFVNRADQSLCEHARFHIPPDEGEESLVLAPLLHLTPQLVVLDPVKKLL